MLRIYDSAKKMEANLNDLQISDSTMQGEYVDFKGYIGRFLLEEAQRMSSPTVRAEAIKILGIRSYLSYCIEHKYKLWDEDLQELLYIL